MQDTAIHSEDRVGLVAAIVLHGLLLAALALQFVFTPPRALTPERMTVSLTTEVGLRSTAPDPVPESRAAIAPTLAEEPTPAVEPSPAQATTPPPPPPPARQNRSTTRQAPPPPRRDNRSRRDPNPGGAAVPQRQASGSRIGDSFLEGQGSSTSTDETRIPASEIGRSAQASIIQSIVRQLRPHWNAPEGVDADQLWTELAFDLNEDGSLKGRPRVIRQGGETDSNRPQKALHAERAIRAVQLAAPFDLPDEYYNAWKTIRGARFDRNLSR